MHGLKEADHKTKLKEYLETEYYLGEVCARFLHREGWNSVCIPYWMVELSSFEKKDKVVITYHGLDQSKSKLIGLIGEDRN